MIAPLKHLEPGMRLKSDVRDLSGRLLLAAGEPIDARHIRIFKIWGVSEADVVPPEGFEEMGEGTPEEQSLEPESEETRKNREALNDLFRFVDRSHPVMVEIYAWSRRRMART